MSTTFAWTVTSMSTLPSLTPDYVVNVQYKVTGTDTSTPPNVASIQGSSTFPESSPTPCHLCFVQPSVSDESYSLKHTLSLLLKTLNTHP